MTGRPEHISQPLVLKFGGTSVQDAEAMRRVVGIVTGYGGEHPVVVTSACAGVTNDLVEIARLCSIGDEAQALAIVDKLAERHESILSDVCKPGSPNACGGELRAMIEDLRRLVHGIVLLGELTDRTADAILSFGERLSSALLTAAFREAGSNAALADSRRFVITDDRHKNAQPLMEEIDRRTAAELVPIVGRHDVVIAQGFIGSTTEGVTTTIGRGGSDHSAALLGAALNAPEIQIWTDVDGVLTADPRVVPSARAVPAMTFTEARELAWFGAKVIHPDTILPATARGIPVSIRNSFQPEAPGTTIWPDGTEIPAGIHSLTTKRGMTLLELTADPARGRSQIEAALPLFARHGASIECAVIAESRSVVAIPSDQWTSSLEAALGATCSVHRHDAMALLCLVGSGFRATPNLLAGPLEALENIPIFLISAGSSDHVIVLGVSGADVDRALAAVHERLFG